MIKEIKRGQKIEADLDKSISPEEESHIKTMIEEINSIDETEDTKEINIEDVPF